MSIGLVVGLLSAGIVFVLLPGAKYAPYTAHAQVYVSARPPTLLTAPESSHDFNVYRGTLIAQMRSREILDPVLKKEVKDGERTLGDLSMLAGQADKVEFLSTEYQIDASVSPEILNITLQGDKPEELVLLVNALAEETVRIVNAHDRDLKAEYIKTLQEIASSYEKDLSPDRLSCSRRPPRRRVGGTEVPGPHVEPYAGHDEPRTPSRARKLVSTARSP